jgi:hypothetical protein
MVVLDMSGEGEVGGCRDRVVIPRQMSANRYAESMVLHTYARLSTTTSSKPFRAVAKIPPLRR